MRVDVALLERRAVDDDEPAELARERLGEERRGLLGREDHRLLRQPQVAGGGADDPPDEEVEDDEEGDLEDKERGLDLNRSQRHGAQCASREKAISVEPSVKRLPSSSASSLTRLPSTSIPLVEPRSTIV